MYRQIFTFLFLLASLNIAQSVKVIKTDKLISGDRERLYFPRFSPDGNYIALTKSDFKGIWLYNISQNELSKINDYYGSGFQPRFSEDGKLHFIINEYKNKKRSPVSKVFDIKTEDETDDTLRSSRTTQVKSENSKIIIYKNGKRRTITPIEEANYIWVSLSPDGEKILFTAPGNGTFICDFEGRIISELGYANAPKWSPDGKWIVYMNDKDDGLKYISSDIYISSVNGEAKFNVTNSNNEIEMYPEWSPDGKSIVYQNLNGDIFKAELEIKK